jgi:hypothetical protein
MANFSSPPGSSSYNKTLLVLQSASHFHINLNDKIFTGVAQNVATMLKGFGLQQNTNIYVNLTDISGVGSDVIMIENSFHGARGKPSRCLGDRCKDMPRIVVQSEQLSMSAGKRRYLRYLRVCHESPNCVIWDFGNLHWATAHGLADSYMLLPIMHQTRFTKPYQNLKPLANRPLDVVFFAVMTKRRATLREQFTQMNWTMRFEVSRNKTYMKESYANAKICLIAHAWNAQGAGEFHRLFEMAPSGCILVVETFEDEPASDVYTQCGGLTFAAYEELVPVVEKTLLEINQTATKSAAEAAKWWERGINWTELLVVKFGKAVMPEIPSGNTTSKIDAFEKVP